MILPTASIFSFWERRQNSVPGRPIFYLFFLFLSGEDFWFKSTIIDWNGLFFGSISKTEIASDKREFHTSCRRCPVKVWKNCRFVCSLRVLAVSSWFAKVRAFFLNFDQILHPCKAFWFWQICSLYCNRTILGLNCEKDSWHNGNYLLTDINFFLACACSKPKNTQQLRSTENTTIVLWLEINRHIFYRCFSLAIV